jgi:hypothetical protein
VALAEVENADRIVVQVGEHGAPADLYLERRLANGRAPLLVAATAVRTSSTK